MAKYSIPTTLDLSAMQMAIDHIVDGARELHALAHNHYDAMADESAAIAQFLDTVDSIALQAEVMHVDLDTAQMEAESLANDEDDDDA
jgi:hypothetical protein